MKALVSAESSNYIAGIPQEIWVIILISVNETFLRSWPLP